MLASEDTVVFKGRPTLNGAVDFESNLKWIAYQQGKPIAFALLLEIWPNEYVVEDILEFVACVTFWDEIWYLEELGRS